MVSNVDSIQQMSDVTFVSRPNVQVIEGEFHMEQRKDPKLKQLIDYLEKKPSANDFDPFPVPWSTIQHIKNLVNKGEVWGM